MRYPRSQAHLNRARVIAPDDVLWTPAVLGQDVLAWWDMLSAGDVGLEGNGVRVIRDRTLNNNDLSQDDHKYQPKWVEHTVANSFEAAFYDGRNDQMGADFTIEHPFTVVQLVRTGEELEPFASSFQGGATDALVYLRNEDLDNELALSAGVPVSSGKVLDPDTNYILVSQFDDANAYVSVNGEVFPTPNIGTNGVETGPKV